jgi:[acyl-carrier-protein] S-malonyltransferase
MEPWLELDQYAQTIASLSEASGFDLRKHGTLSDANTIRDTTIAQPLIVAASIASAGLLGSGWAGVLGHSVGEVSAAAISGVLTPELAIKFVGKRADEMSKASASGAASMAAILGGDADAVLSRLAELYLTPANYNGAGQIVAAGAQSDMDALVADPPAGARVIKLQVGGAFHTASMKPAVAALRQYALDMPTDDPEGLLWSNEAAQIVGEGRAFLDLMIGQVANPVRWDLCMDAMVKAGVTAMIEVSPAGVLSGLAKRSIPGVEVLALKSPDQLEDAKQLIEKHS